MKGASERYGRPVREPRIGGRCKLVEEEDFRAVVETEEQRTEAFGLRFE